MEIKKCFFQVEELLEAGACPDVEDAAGWRPLHEAACSNSDHAAKVAVRITFRQADFAAKVAVGITFLLPSPLLASPRWCNCW